LSTKHGITLANSVGLVDSDYRGELIVPLINHGKEAFTVEPGMRIAQLVVLPILTPELKEVSSLDETDRGAGGFGASGLS
jgi:dUTP pyrophosphatase